MKINFTIFIILVFAVCTSGQVKKLPTKTTQKPKPITIKATISEPIFKFDETLNTLPVNYLGDKKQQVINAISQLRKTEESKDFQLRKDEFETTAQYKKRIEELKKNSGDVSHTKRFVFVLNYQFSDYDADNQILNITTAFTQINGKISAALGSETITDSYVGSNAFGATANVSKTITSYYGIEFQGGNATEPLVTAQLKMDIPTAQATKPNIRTLVYFELIPPYINSAQTKKDPTLYSPSDSTNNSNIFTGKLLQVWFIDQTTGKVLYKKIVND